MKRIEMMQVMTSRPNSTCRGGGAVFVSRSGLRALLLGVAVSLVGAQGAGAQGTTPVDWYTGDKTSDPDYKPSIVLDASGSFTSHQTNFGAVALTAALDGNLRQDGFRARVEGIAGEYNYFTTLTPVAPAMIGLQKKIDATQENGGVLGGYGWVSRDWTFALYGGAQVINTNLSYNYPGSPQGLRIGAKFVGEFYGSPTRNTMASGYAAFSTVNNEYYSRFKAGYMVWSNVFLGPEFLALGNEFYSEYRAGLHLTGLRIGQLSLGISGGAASNRTTGSGGYGIVDAQLGF